MLRAGPRPGRHARRSRLRRGTLLGLVLLTVLTATTQPASGFWRAAGAGTGAAATATLGVPVVAVSGIAKSGTVQVSWTVATTSGGTPAQSYVVRRTDEAGGGAVTACGTSQASPTTALSCSDTGVPSGTYRYVVTARLNGWTAASAPSATFAVDVTAPTISVQSVSPAANAHGFHKASPVTVVLVAADLGPSGLVGISHRTDGGAWVTVSGPTASVPVAGEGTRTVEFLATDGAANESTIGSQLVRIDTTAPTVTTLTRATGQAERTKLTTAAFAVVFSEPVTGFVPSDLVLAGVSGAVATIEGSGSAYAINVSGMSSQGTLSVSLAAGMVVDLADNGNAASGVATVVRDTTPPTIPTRSINRSGSTITLSGTTGPVAIDAATVTVTFCRGVGILFLTLLPPVWSSCSSIEVDVPSVNGTWTVSVTPDSDAFAYYARMVPTDAAGNIGATSYVGPVG